VDFGIGSSIYWTLPVVATIIHFTTLQHINQRLVFSVRYHFRLLPVTLFTLSLFLYLVSFLTGLYLYLYVYVSVSLSVCICICMCLYLCLHLSVSSVSHPLKTVLSELNRERLIEGLGCRAND
jgi:hypothetical protein